VKYVDPKITPVEPRDVVRLFGSALERLPLKYASGPKCIAILTAQSALETGNWKSIWNYNWGNVKAGQSWKWDYTCIKLNEVINGVTQWFAPEGALGRNKNGPVIEAKYDVPPGHPQTRMRAFPTALDGALDHIAFLALDSNPNDNKPNRYGKAFQAACDGDPVAYAHELRVAGYYTADEAPYARAVQALTTKFYPIAVDADAEPDFLPPEEHEQLVQDMIVVAKTDVAHLLPLTITDEDYARIQADKRAEVGRMFG
jgi:hypothetical protein